MADKMMRISGRGTDGTAKPIKTDNDGILEMKPYSVIADDPRGLVPISEPTLLTIPTYDGSGQAVHPSAVYIPNAFGGYKFWMIMTPYPAGNSAYENPSILCSNDGVTFVVPAGVTNPIFGPPDESNYSDPHLEYDYTNRLLVLYFQHNLDSKIYRSTSANGVTWSALVDCGALGSSPSIIKPHTSTNKWVAFLPSEIPYRMDSDDGITFDNGLWLDFPGLGKSGHAWFGTDDIGYHALLNISPKNRDVFGTNLYYAYSHNGFDWRLFLSPILGKGLTAKAIYRSTMVNVGDYYRIYYSQWNSDSTWSIGYMDVRLAFSRSSYPEGKTIFPLYRNKQIRNTTAVYAFPGNYTTADWTNILDWNRYKHKSILYTNSHDQALKLSFISNFRGDLTRQSSPDQIKKYNGGTPLLVEYTLPASDISSPTLITAADAPILDVFIPSKMRISVVASSAPTSGELSMYLCMWN